MTQKDASARRAPSRTILVKSAAWTFCGALAVTIAFVLPAEYGVDPTGIGQRLGLLRPAVAPAQPVVAEPVATNPDAFPPIPDAGDFDFYDPETLADPFSRSQPAPFRSDSLVIALDEFEQVEVKTTMRQGDALVYSWKLVEGETVYSDFHADPHQAELYPEDYFVRYHESESRSASGSLVAPFDGNHGWYWLNIEERPVRIELEVRGFYGSIGEIMRSFQ